MTDGAMNSGVVITGVGVMSGFGVGIDAFWAGLVGGRSALGSINSIDATGFESAFGAEVLNVDVKAAVPKPYRKAVKVMARDSELAVVAAQLAAFDARIATRGSGLTSDFTTAADADAIDPTRSGCHIGAGLIAAETRELTAALATSTDEDGAFSLKKWGSAEGGSAGMNNLPPLWMLKYLPNMLACHVTIIHGLEGPSNTVTCAEASGVLCAGESLRVIQRGDADLCLTGGVESKVNPMGIMRLSLAGRLAPTSGVDSTDASAIVRPFDPDATGSLIGEGGAILIMETEERATSRGADIYCRVLGFAAAQSISHPLPGVVVTIDPEALDEGVRSAVERALADAGVEPGDIDAIFPSGYGIPSVDLGEANALQAVFGERLSDIPLVPLAPSVGLCAAGHGAMQVAAAAASIKNGELPALQFGGNPISRKTQRMAVSPRRVLVCSSAFGGQCAALVLGETVARDAE